VALLKGKMMSLLLDNWVPVRNKGDSVVISLKRLLCLDEDWRLCLPRDDMELATLQLIVCIVQVVFMPDNRTLLRKNNYELMSEQDYDQGVMAYTELFDLLHPITPFMQTASVKAEKNAKNWATLQKLFVGLPEKTAPSIAFFNTGNEIQGCDLGLAAIAIFQQATNGFGLGSHFYSVGLKGSMPLTTLIYDINDSLRSNIWKNILHREFLLAETSLLDDVKESEPSWVKAISFDKRKPENTHRISLLRGLFWQPAKVKLTFKNGLATGFLKETGLSYSKYFWQHPHTPLDYKKLAKNDPKEKPYLSARNDLPLWGQMLDLVYSKNQDEEGVSSALVVQQFQKVFKSKPLHLAVGAYVKGGSAEKLAGRKHEIYSLPAGWEHQAAEIKQLVHYGLDAQRILNTAVYNFGRHLKAEGSEKGQENSNLIKKQLQPKARADYFNNSEAVMHSILRHLKFSDIEHYKQAFSQLAKDVFEHIFMPYQHEAKFQKAIIISRATMYKALNSI
jgi:CRISPR system Cascade subunit CasA